MINHCFSGTTNADGVQIPASGNSAAAPAAPNEYVSLGALRREEQQPNGISSSGSASELKQQEGNLNPAFQTGGEQKTSADSTNPSNESEGRPTDASKRADADLTSALGPPKEANNGSALSNSNVIENARVEGLDPSPQSADTQDIERGDKDIPKVVDVSSVASEVKDPPTTKSIFAALQVLTAIFGSFAHGGNDVRYCIII